MDWEWNHILVFSLLLSLGVVAGVTVQPLTDQTVNKGDPVVLDCTIQNLGDTSRLYIFWYHGSTAVMVNGGLAVDNPRYQLDTRVAGHWKLTIRQAELEDRGTWRCQVQGPGLDEDDAGKQMNLEVLAPPAITTKTRDMAPMPGSTVTLWCNATGSPEPTVTWTRPRPAGSLPSGAGFMTGNPLVITEISNDWRGLYQCHVSNGIGEAVTDAVFLQMEYSPVARPKTKLVTAPIGSSAHLICIGQSFPAVTSVDRVQWLKDDRLVVASEGYQMSVKLDTDMDPYRETSNATLIVTSVQTDDLATYTCRFENLLGSAEARVELAIGKQVNPETGKSRSRASTVMAATATSMAAVTVAMMLMQL